MVERVIEVDLKTKEDLFERYNHKKVSRDLISWLIDTALSYDKNDEIRIVINNALGDDINCSDLIIEGLKFEYERSLKNNARTNVKQVIYLIAGVLALVCSHLMIDEVFQEVISIGGWVLLWEMVELEIFTDVNGRKKRKILKKLLSNKIIENKV